MELELNDIQDEMYSSRFLFFLSFNTFKKGKFVEFDNNSGKVDYVLYNIFGLNLWNTFTGEYLSYAYLIQSAEHKSREGKTKWVVDEFMTTS